MNQDKQIIIDELLARVNNAPYVIAFDYTAINVTEFTGLRSKLAEVGAKCQVAKNKLMSKALSLANQPDISAKLKGQIAYVTGEAEVVSAAKIVAEFAKTSKKAQFVSGFLDGKELTVEEIQALSQLPTREVQLAMLLGAINGVGSALARVVQAYADKDKVEEEATEA